MICHCRREAKGFYFQRHKEQPRRWCCSMACLDTAHRLNGMIDPTQHEIAAIEAASEPAGQYIESLGRTDMATWSRDEWLQFLECVVTGYVDELGKLTQDELPF